MGLLGRLRRAVRRIFTGTPDIPDEIREAPSRPPRTERGREPRRKPSLLPEGWQIEGTYIEGKGLSVDMVPSDKKIAQSDAIIVSYTDRLGKDYRTIHGANSRADIGKLIRKVTMRDSPVR